MDGVANNRKILYVTPRISFLLSEEKENMSRVRSLIIWQILIIAN